MLVVVAQAAPVLEGLEAQAVVAAPTTIASIKPQNWAVPNPSPLAQGVAVDPKTRAEQVAATPRSVQLQRDNFKLEARQVVLAVAARTLEAQAELPPMPVVLAAAVEAVPLLVVLVALAALAAVDRQPQISPVLGRAGVRPTVVVAAEAEATQPTDRVVLLGVVASAKAAAAARAAGQAAPPVFRGLAEDLRRS